MLGEYKVGRCSRHCYKLERPLREGEFYYSVILESDEDYERRDYSSEAWDGPPEGAIGHWKCRMPKAEDKKLVLAPREVLVDLLRKMEHFPDKAKARYLLALTMMRKRVLRPAPLDDDQRPGAEILQVQVIEDGSLIDIPTCEISRSESDQLLEELNELLYCDASEIESEELEPED
ncbi:MAG: hypothetical protein HKN47_27730 [Pirellulaceae bacterium]|nr:hypothetical protein [Pirellulaceae bacterium]